MAVHAVSRDLVRPPDPVRLCAHVCGVFGEMPKWHWSVRGMTSWCGLIGEEARCCWVLVLAFTLTS
jgi:hypothetical protein